ncbi:hypothetical protein HDV01_002324 [Terramyces sp. JEL0728]|nr:hypothetical protein HDV01_002324 [Terramyces sp. JEL0728]
MSSSPLLLKMTAKNLSQKYTHPYDADFSSYLGQTEYDDVLRYLNEHTKMATTGVTWILAIVLFPLCMAFSGYSITKSDENGFSTTYIPFGCTFAVFFALFSLSYLANRGIYPEFVLHVNDINAKYRGRIKVKLEQIHTGTTVTTTTYSSGRSSSSVTRHYDYNVYIYGTGRAEASKYTSPAPTYQSSPAPTYRSSPAPTYQSSPPSNYTPQTPTYNSTSNYGTQKSAYVNNKEKQSYSPGSYTNGNYQPAQNYQPNQNYQPAQTYGAPQYQTNPNGNRIPQSNQYQYGK